MLYHAYEMTHAAITPFRAAARLGAQAFRNPVNPFTQSVGFRAAAAACEMFVNATRRYGKPEFGLATTEVEGVEVDVVEEVVLCKPFCNLLHFRRNGPAALEAALAAQPKLLIVAPLSGHFATLLRGTVEAMLPGHDVYITDWIDAREVPLARGRFDLNDYIDYMIEFCEVLGQHGERPALMAVCQPGVPVFAASALMAEDAAPFRPASITLMGSPIDTRISPTEPTELADGKPLSWFEKNVITTVPLPHAGFMRRVYPGFLQLSSFMSMNLDRHMDAHLKQFRHLIRGDGDSAQAHRAFYDEYLAVMDMTAEFYLQTVSVVFQEHLLPKGEFLHRDRRVDPSAIRDIAILTVEGENDDITGRGQTEAALALATRLPKGRKQAHLQPKVGHYGVFNGGRFRREIQPVIAAFIEKHRAHLKA